MQVSTRYPFEVTAICASPRRMVECSVKLNSWSQARALVAASLLGLVVAGCGGGSDGSNGPVVAPQPPPTGITITSPTPLADGLTGTVTIAVSAPSSAASVEFEIDGASLGAPDTSPPFEASVDTTRHAAGQHVLRARARDSAGQTSDWSAVTVRFGGNGDITQGFTKDEAWVAGLAGATAFAEAHDGRLFIAEQGGALRIAEAGVLRAQPFLRLNVDTRGERGLIGVALHPDFASNGRVYVHYTSLDAGAHNRISMFQAASPDGNVSTGVETVLVDLPALSAATNHNGGAIHFGADGMLYVGVGENASPRRAADLSDPLGKLLRFNDDGSIPTDNPHFASQSGLARAIWAHGLRNPFTFAFQPGTGRLHINDVGQGTWEEIDLGTAGADYGWPASEGPDNIGAGITPPLFTYRHTETAPPGSGPGGFFTGFAIAGGAFYPDSGNFPARYRGNYFFADYIGGWVARLDPDDASAASIFARVAGGPVDMLVAGDGALLVLTRGTVVRISAP
jgi:glucose/arabinose dehydrogenase